MRRVVVAAPNTRVNDKPLVHSITSSRLRLVIVVVVFPDHCRHFHVEPSSLLHSTVV